MVYEIEVVHVLAAISSTIMFTVTSKDLVVLIIITINLRYTNFLT